MRRRPMKSAFRFSLAATLLGSLLVFSPSRADDATAVDGSLGVPPSSVGIQVAQSKQNDVSPELRSIKPLSMQPVALAPLHGRRLPNGLSFAERTDTAVHLAFSPALQPTTSTSWAGMPVSSPPTIIAMTEQVAPNTRTDGARVP